MFKVYYSDPIVITPLEYTHIPVCWFDNIFSTYFLVAKFSLGTSGTNPIHALVPRKSYPKYHHFSPQLVQMHIQNNNISPATS